MDIALELELELELEETLWLDMRDEALLEEELFELTLDLLLEELLILFEVLAMGATTSTILLVRREELEED